MQVSAELRWFWQDSAPDGLKEWFCGSALHRFSAGGGEKSRTDTYLKESAPPELSIKSRDEKPGTPTSSIEVKGLVVSEIESVDTPPFSGPIELWTKWTSKALVNAGFSAETSISTEKQRWLRKFDTSGARPKEIELDSVEQPKLDDRGQKQPLPIIGCNVELTRVLIGAETWWTFGFESFGPFKTVAESLRAVAKELASRKVPTFSAKDKLASYPAWLAERLKNAGLTTGTIE